MVGRWAWNLSGNTSGHVRARGLRLTAGSAAARSKVGNRAELGGDSELEGMISCLVVSRLQLGDRGVRLLSRKEHISAIPGGAGKKVLHDCMIAASAK